MGPPLRSALPAPRINGKTPLRQAPPRAPPLRRLPREALRPLQRRTGAAGDAPLQKDLSALLRPDRVPPAAPTGAVGSPDSGRAARRLTSALRLLAKCPHQALLRALLPRHALRGRLRLRLGAAHLRRLRGARAAPPPHFGHGARRLVLHLPGRPAQGPWCADQCSPTSAPQTPSASWLRSAWPAPSAAARGGFPARRGADWRRSSKWPVTEDASLGGGGRLAGLPRQVRLDPLRALRLRAAARPLRFARLGRAWRAVPP